MMVRWPVTSCVEVRQGPAAAKSGPIVELLRDHFESFGSSRRHKLAARAAAAPLNSSNRLIWQPVEEKIRRLARLGYFVVGPLLHFFFSSKKNSFSSVLAPQNGQRIVAKHQLRIGGCWRIFWGVRSTATGAVDERKKNCGAASCLAVGCEVRQGC